MYVRVYSRTTYVKDYKDTYISIYEQIFYDKALWGVLYHICKKTLSLPFCTCLHIHEVIKKSF